VLQQSNVRAPRQSGATTREVTAQGQFGSRTAATPESASTLHRGGAWAFPIGAALKSGSLIHDEDSPVSRRKTTYQSRVRDRGETRDDPRISFVVSWNPDVVLSAMLLHDLHSACVRCGRELVIVTRGPEILSGTSRVHIVPAPADADSAAMRAHGARRAAGDILLMLRDGTITGAALEALCLTSGRRESHLHLRSSAAPPALSVIIPVHRNEQTLESVLAAVRGSDMSAARTELIVVNDVGAPELTTVAARYADVIVRLEGSTSYGPAYARNRGFELQRASWLSFSMPMFVSTGIPCGDSLAFSSNIPKSAPSLDHTITSQRSVTLFHNTETSCDISSTNATRVTSPPSGPAVVLFARMHSGKLGCSTSGVSLADSSRTRS